MGVFKQLKRVMLSLVVLASSASLMATEVDYMNVYSISQASFQSIQLDNIDKITFSSADEVNIVMNGIETSMPIDDIEVITFGDTDITSIEEEFIDDSVIEIRYLSQAGELSISAPDAITTVQVYNMQGVQMMVQTPNATTASYNIAAYPAGIYLIAVQAGEAIKTAKIIK